MKRGFLFIALLAGLLPLRVHAQDSNNAATIAAKQEAEERFKRLAADVQTLQSDNETLHTKLNALEQELQTLRDAVNKPADNSSMQDALKRLAEKIEEVDKKRLADKDVISEEIRKSIGGLVKSLGNNSTPPPPIPMSHPKPGRDPSPPTDTAPSLPEKGYPYTIQEGDTLGAIVKQYNIEYKSKGMKTITMRQAREANPSVDWNRLKVGQKIIIPQPAGS